MLFCSDLAVLIFTTLLADIQRLNLKSAQGPRGEDMQFFNPFYLYCFTLIPNYLSLYFQAILRSIRKSREFSDMTEQDVLAQFQNQYLLKVRNNNQVLWFL